MKVESEEKMKDYSKKIRKIIILIFISALVGILGSMAYAGITYYKAGEYKGKIPIDKKDITEKIEKDNGERKEVEIKIPRQYINKLSFQYDNAITFSNVDIYIDKLNIYGVVEEQHITDKFMVGMPRSVVNINGQVSKIKIIYDVQENPVILSNFVIDNTFKPNPLLAMFIMSILFLVGFLILFRTENAEHPGIATFICILISSTCLLVLLPAYIEGWDEQIHFINAYELGVTKENEYVTQAEDYMYNNAYLLNKTGFPAEESIEERLDMIRVLNTQMKYKGVTTDDYSLGMSSVGYVFQAMALKIGNCLKVPFYISWLIGKFTNVLLYAIILGVSVAILPIGKRLLMVISMLPIMIFQSTCFTYDVTVISFIILSLCILIKEYIYEDQKFSYKWRVIFGISIIIGCLPKAVYCPFILGGLFMKKDKFYSKKDYLIFKASIILGMLALLSTFVLPTLLAPPQVSDTRGGDTSEARQIEYVFGQPLAYAIVLIKNILNNLADYIMGTNLLCNWAYLGIGKYTYCYSALLVGTTLTDTYAEKKVKKRTLNLNDRLWLFVQMAMVIAMIWTALYLSFTEVGKTVIAGVQARYYLPFIFVLYLCFHNDKINVKFNKCKYQMTIMALSIGMLFQQMWSMILITKCL